MRWHDVIAFSSERRRCCVTPSCASIGALSDSLFLLNMLKLASASHKAMIYIDRRGWIPILPCPLANALGIQSA